MNRENYTSTDFSKKLRENGCELPASFYWATSRRRETPKFYFRSKKYPTIKNLIRYPAYDILNDICVKHIKEFWGIDKRGVNGWARACMVMELMVRGRKEEAEKYIWDTCLFNPANSK